MLRTLIQPNNDRKLTNCEKIEFFFSYVLFPNFLKFWNSCSKFFREFMVCLQRKILSDQNFSTSRYNKNQKNFCVIITKKLVINLVIIYFSECLRIKFFLRWKKLQFWKMNVTLQIFDVFVIKFRITIENFLKSVEFSNIWKFYKIVKIFKNRWNVPKSQEFSEIVRIFKNRWNIPKSQEFDKIVRIFKKSYELSKIGSIF